MGRSLGGIGRPCTEDVDQLLTGGIEQQVDQDVDVGEADSEIEQTVDQDVELTPVKAAAPTMQAAIGVDVPPDVTREMQASAAAIVAGATIDGFEDGDLAEYTVRNGDASWATTQQTTVQGGSYALELDADGQSSGSAVESTSGLITYPAQGDTFEYWGRYSSGTETNKHEFFFATQGDGANYMSSSYQVYFKPSADELSVQGFGSNSGSIPTDTAAVSFADDTWYRVEVDWATDGTITVTAYDAGGTQLGQVSIQDTTYVSGGIGAAVRSGATAWFDEISML